MGAIEIDRLVARDILHAVQPATPARNRIPALGTVLLKASGSMLTASGSDLDLQVDATGPLQCDDADLTVAVRRSVLATAIRSGGPTLRLDVDGTGDDARLVVQPDQDTTIRLWTAPPEDMALVDDEPDQLGFELTPDDVADVATMVDACSTDVSRPVLCGIGVDDDGLWAATDSYRLAWHQLADTAAILGDTIVPARLWDLVAGWRDPDPVRVSRPVDDTVRVAGVQTRGRDGARTIQVVARQRLIDGSFPTVTKLLPDADSVGLAVTVDASLLAEKLDTIRRLGKVVGIRNTPVQLAVDGDDLRLGYGHREALEVDAGVPVKESAGDTDLTVAFNPTYLAQAIDTVTARGEDPTVTVHVRDPLKPGHLTGSSPVRVLLMPMRVN